MTTPANRAPRFVVVDKDGLLMSDRRDEESARDVALRLDREDPEDAPHTIHPIGAALPGPAPVKTMGQVAKETWKKELAEDDRWDRVAAAVIAAHEAGRAEKLVGYPPAGAALVTMHPDIDPFTADSSLRKRALDVSDAVIAAYKASVRYEYETVTRWAVRHGRYWHTARGAYGTKSIRTIFGSEKAAEDAARLIGDDGTVVPVTFRRRAAP